MKTLLFFLLTGGCFYAYSQDDVSGVRVNPLVARNENYYISKFVVDSNSSLSVVDPNNFPAGTILESEIKPNLKVVYGTKTTIVFKLKKGKKIVEQWEPTLESDKYMVDNKIRCLDLWSVNVKYKVCGYHGADNRKVDQPLIWMEIYQNKTEGVYVVRTLEVKNNR